MGNEDIIYEGYLLNYFSNELKFKKLNKRPEFDKKTVKEYLDYIKKEYKRILKSSDGKKVAKDPKLYKKLLFPVGKLQYRDDEIYLCVSLDKTSFTPGAATIIQIPSGDKMKENEFRHAVIVYPNFFDEEEDSQIFILLHELGHIRLEHIENYYLPDLFSAAKGHRYQKKLEELREKMNQEIKKEIEKGLSKAEAKKKINEKYSDKIRKYTRIAMRNDGNKHRRDVMLKGDVVYPEANADLYAVLNGSDMYSVINDTFDRDFETKDGYTYDLRPTNAEMSARYRKVYQKYMKLNKDGVRKMHKSVKKEGVNLLSFSPLDIAQCAVYELAYDNPYTESLSIQDKDNLYDILYDIGVTTPLPDIIDESVNMSEYNAIEDFNTLKKTYKDTLVETVVTAYKEARIDTMMSGNVDEELIQEAYLVESLTKKERDEIDIEDFGIPSERKYPLDTEKHVMSAIKLFGKCEKKYRKELAHNIFKAMKKYNIPKSVIGPKNSLSNYLYMWEE